MRRGLRGLASRLTKPAEELESEELREVSADATCTPIDQVADRTVCRCRGTVRSVSLRPRSEQAPALVVDLDDGHRSLTVVWLGRRQIAGITPGVFMVVEGRVCMTKGSPTMFNPTYELSPRAGH